MAVQNDSTLVTKGDLKTLYQNKIRPYLGGGVAVTEVVGTLSAGSTTLVLQDSAITTDSTIDIYTSVYGVSPTDVAVSNGSVTLTFDAQQSALEVKVRISPKKFVSGGGSSERESVSVTAETGETFSQLLDRLYALIDLEKISGNTYLRKTGANEDNIFQIGALPTLSNPFIYFTCTSVSSPTGGHTLPMYQAEIRSSNSMYFMGTNSFSDKSASAATNATFTLYY